MALEWNFLFLTDYSINHRPHQHQLSLTSAYILSTSLIHLQGFAIALAGGASLCDRQTLSLHFVSLCINTAWMATGSTLESVVKAAVKAMIYHDNQGTRTRRKTRDTQITTFSARATTTAHSPGGGLQGNALCMIKPGKYGPQLSGRIGVELAQ